MAADREKIQSFNIVVVGQANRLQYEAILFAASLRHTNPDFQGRLFVATPNESPLWSSSPTLRNKAVIARLEALSAEILPFDTPEFGEGYPNGNKIQCLLALPEGEPFVFFDTDTLILDDLARVPFDFDRPSASQNVEGTWPRIELYGPGYTAIWRSLYDKFGLDFDSSLDLSQPDEFWKRYLYFNAGWFYGRCPREFGARFLRYATQIRDDAPEELVCQPMWPWLDQIALPLVIHSFGGGRDVLPTGLLDGEVSCHYRLFPLLYAREDDRVVEVLETIAAPNDVKKVLKQYDPIKFMVYHGRGQKVRALFDRQNLPRREQAIRKIIKEKGFWMR
ncbi:hypothetical protein E7681_14390 [Thalassobius vesicularis]|uniref:Uncharacterized protein n=1 Tax=Thalassobius vesicularis TaxID=1294297 RepID=A0A4S3M7A5_9RHOB|nr:hypothetical protein [Thalassobius vesicularis]THD72614.1 hypothetical protein E7681_14390 [Thalassobius vesicularis]